MLFKQLYNWIKYKTLPPSLLFKNRLFIERDSKNKRIFSNLGLTFRNSKWTDFQTSNTSARFTLTYGKYLRYAVIAIFVIIVIWKLNFLYNYTFLLNTVLFFYWMTIDAIDYYVAFLFWILISTAFILKNVVYSYFFFNNLSVVKKNPSSMRNKNLKNHVGLNHVKFLTKKDIKMIALEWVNTSKNPLKNKAISIFFTHQNKHPLIANPALFYNLFRSHYFLNFEKRYATVDALSLWFKTLTKTNTPFCASRLMLGESTIPYSSNLLDYFLRTERGASMFNGNTASTAFYQTRYVWNIANAASLSTRTPRSAPSEFFYLPCLTPAFFANSKISSLVTQHALTDQMNVSKWNRWLYRYNILHRKLFKNSHKLTLTKKLLNNGFWNSDLTKKNLWVSEMLNKQNNTNTLHFIANLTQFEFLTNTARLLPIARLAVLFNNTSPTVNLSLLREQENSFFWFIKRSYMFTNLGVNFSNSILNKKFNKIRVENPCVTGFNKHAYVTNFVINSINYQLSFFTRNINSQLIGFGTNMSKQELDIYMIFDDATVLTGENLAILSWVTAPAFSTQNDSFLTYFHNLNLVPTNTNAAANFYTKPFNFPDLTAPFLSIIQNNEARNLSNVIFFSFWK